MNAGIIQCAKHNIDCIVMAGKIVCPKCAVEHVIKTSVSPQGDA